MVCHLILTLVKTFEKKLSEILNCSDTTSRDNLLNDLSSTITSSDLSMISISPDMVFECLSNLGKDKSDGSSLTSNHLILAASSLSSYLANLFTVIIRHGYMPTAWRDCILVPIPKPLKDPAQSDSYRPIALAPNLSKVLEKCILLSFRSCFITSDLQFGFKPGFSTDLCSGVLKNVVSQYIHKGSKVYSCFLDASKAFDRVNHEVLLKLLLKRQIPCAILRFLFAWYRDQLLSVRWNSSLSSSFGVSNGVRQGGVLSPILFTIYIDELLLRLSKLGVGCHSGHYFGGSLSYADDIALLAPSPSALRALLHECEVYAREFNLVFNGSKTQLICFRLKSSVALPSNAFKFLGHSLTFAYSVTHLGHTLHFSLDDTADIVRVTSDMCRKANYLLHIFSPCDPIVKTKLVVSHCLSLYGSVLWSLKNKQLKSLEIAFNNILRKIWKLPRQCHTRILHLTANVQSLFNKIISMFSSFLSRALLLDSTLCNHVFLSSSLLSFTPVGYNEFYMQNFVKSYSNDDIICANSVLGNLYFDTIDSTNSILFSVCCD